METRNMENIKEEIKKQCGEEPERNVEVESRRKAWNGEFMKYYSYKEAAGSLNDLKRLDQLFDFEKTPGRGVEEQKWENIIRKQCPKADIFTTEELEKFFNPGIYGDMELYLFYLCCA
jgi:hypothetical protein